MKAIVITEAGAPDVLKPQDRPTPQPGTREVLIRVAAAGVNRPDIAQRKGHYPAPPGASPDIPGLEVAGVVTALGNDCQRWKVGDTVCALLSGGGYAEYCAVPEGQCLPVPQGLSMVEAAALPETFFTVWSNVFDRARLVAGESILVHGGSGGIGVTAIQLAHAFGATVYTTAGGKEKCAFCESIGAARAIDYTVENFKEVITQITGGKGVDVILDMIGGDYTANNLEILAPDGRLVQINYAKGEVATIRLGLILRKRLTLTGSTLRPRDVAFKSAIAVKLEANVWPLLVSGRVKPVIYKTFPLVDAAAAHRLMEEGTHYGKLVLTIS